MKPKTIKEIWNTYWICKLYFFIKTSLKSKNQYKKRQKTI
jgi:hypothetical protein